jgi:hypothetical protein
MGEKPHLLSPEEGQRLSVQPGIGRSQHGHHADSIGHAFPPDEFQRGQSIRATLYHGQLGAVCGLP